MNPTPVHRQPCLADLPTGPISFFWNGNPPRATSQTRRRTASRPSGYRTPQNRLACATLRAVVETHAPRVPLVGAVEVRVYFTFAGPKFPPIYKTTRPDADNLSKDFLDALQKAGYFLDDAQVASLMVKKFAGSQPGIYCRVEAIQ